MRNVSFMLAAVLFIGGCGGPDGSVEAACSEYAELVRLEEAAEQGDVGTDDLFAGIQDVARAAADVAPGAIRPDAEALADAVDEMTAPAAAEEADLITTERVVEIQDSVSDWTTANCGFPVQVIEVDPSV